MSHFFVVIIWICSTEAKFHSKSLSKRESSLLTTQFHKEEENKVLSMLCLGEQCHVVSQVGPSQGSGNKMICR